MKRPSLRERYRQELRASILDAAREAFVQEGYEAVSMRALAARIGCSHASIYLQFKDKEALFDCLVEESFRQLADSLRGLKEAGRRMDPIRLVKRAARAYVDFALRNPGVYEFAFILRRPGGPRRVKPHLAYEYLRSLVQFCMDRKAFRRMDVDVASQALWAAVHGVTSLLIFRPTFPWAGREAVIQRVIDSAVDSLAATGKGKARRLGPHEQ